MTGDQVSVTVAVTVDPATAFAIFTEETDLWWRRGPAYRVAGREPGTLQFEPGVGGRLFESFATPAGERVHVAGRILAWEPPARLVFEWRGVNFAEHERTEVEVRFDATPSGTRVTLVHRGFAALPADHPVRHGLDAAGFTRMLGMWWVDLLRSLRERALEGRERG